MRLCECGICKDLTSRHASSTRDATEDTECTLATAMTIILLVQLVAGLERGDMVNPTIVGLQQFYRQYLRRIESIWRLHASPPTISDALGLLLKQDGVSNSRQRLLTPAYLMADVQCLFTRCRPTQDEIYRNNYRIAFSYNNICCYLEVLRDLSSNAAVLRRIHVPPGRIQSGDREYTAVWDCTPAPQP